jgi:predicted phosphodiesterase
MAYKYKHFIPQNIAPKGAKEIGVYSASGEKLCIIPLGSMSPITKEKLYSFGIISDLHISHNVYVAWQPIPKFDNALTLFEDKGCAFCIACGDLTNTGFYLRTDEGTAGTEYLDERQFAKYMEICDKHTIPVYELCGNHESYYGIPITNNLNLLETYTGKGVLSYTITQGNDLFILCGQNSGSSVMSADDFQWLGETLEANKNKRCFVFIHSHIDDNIEGGVEDSGNPCYARENSIFGNGYWGATNRTNFINLMKQYPNAILFHGHTHMKFEAQEFDKDANFSEKNGFKSVHVPSSGAPRKLLSEDGTWEAADTESQGYIVDVYDDCIVLNGMDLINKKPVPIGVYKIDI